MNPEGSYIGSTVRLLIIHDPGWGRTDKHK